MLLRLWHPVSRNTCPSVSQSVCLFVCPAWLGCVSTCINMQSNTNSCVNATATTTTQLIRFMGNMRNVTLKKISAKTKQTNKAQQQQSKKLPTNPAPIWLHLSLSLSLCLYISRSATVARRRQDKQCRIIA